MKKFFILILVVFIAGCSVFEPPKNNVILITIDTLRADHLSCYGYSRNTTPNIDKWASEGILFEQTYTPVPRTNQSLASLFTSRLPYHHGVRSLSDFFAYTSPRLSTVLRKEDYYNHAIVSHPGLTRESGFAKGFEKYDDRYKQHNQAKLLTEKALKWLKNNKKRPFFLWLHYMDPHWLYAPPPPFDSEYTANHKKIYGMYKNIMDGKLKRGDVIYNNSMNSKERKTFKDLYDGEIAFTDRHLGRIRKHLQNSGLNKNTLVTITSDHGESLGEHDYYFEHGEFLYDPTLHVPMIIIPPGSDSKDLRVESHTSLMDLTPTLLEMLGIERNFKTEGVSLIPFGEKSHKILFGETGAKLFKENPRRYIKGIRGKWRYLRTPNRKLIYIPHSNSDKWEFYNLKNDPGETNNLTDKRNKRFSKLKTKLKQKMENETLKRNRSFGGMGKDNLRALGYIN